MAIERIVPGTVEWAAYYSNHIFRYQFAFEQLKKAGSKKILDAACGVGYGSDFISTSIADATVVAIDRSDEALKVAAKHFNNNNRVTFMQDDCHSLANASSYGLYDAVVSFETLEHLPDPASFLRSCYNNMSHGAQLIISTPNKLVTSPTGETDWEFHEEEYTPTEFKSMLQDAGFNAIDIYGQKFSTIGRLRQELRGELNILHSNPFIRLGKLVQKKLRRASFSAVLPEQIEDFESVRYDDLSIIENESLRGPFVLIGVCKK
jgi:SAM-dependent methyltransferase